MNKVEFENRMKGKIENKEFCSQGELILYRFSKKDDGFNGAIIDDIMWESQLESLADLLLGQCGIKIGFDVWFGGANTATLNQLYILQKWGVRTGEIKRYVSKDVWGESEKIGIELLF